MTRLEQVIETRTNQLIADVTGQPIRPVILVEPED